jgi:hypothetical protein
MIGKLRTKWFKVNFVLRHRWEKGGFENFEAYRMKKEFKLGLWLKTYKAVGKAKGPLKFIFSDENLVRGYMIGIDLIVCKMWMDVSGPTLEIPIE